MLAVIELGGNQFTVQKGDVIDVKNIDGEVESKIDTPALLVTDEAGKDVKVGTPTVDGSKVELKIVEQFRDEKIDVFKMKAKKRYSKKNGFRQSMTKLEVLSIA